MTNKEPNQNREQKEEETQDADHSLFVGGRHAMVGGVLAVAIAVGGQLLVGQVYSGSEAGKLLEAVIPSARSLGSSVITATGSILALMLTMLGLTHNAETTFDSHFYKRIERIGLLSSIALSGAILLLLLLSIPLQEADNVPTTMYQILYYVLIGVSAILAGLLVAIVLMLYNAMTSILKVVSPLEMPGQRNPLHEKAQQDK